MKVYITKYALTLGIQEREVIDVGHGTVKDIDTFMPQYFYVEGKGWHKTKESALKRAEEMRESRIKAIEKQIEKLKELTFK